MIMPLQTVFYDLEWALGLKEPAIPEGVCTPADCSNIPNVAERLSCKWDADRGMVTSQVSVSVTHVCEMSGE